jgi:hypothetical protein
VVIALDYVNSDGWTPEYGYVKEIGYVTGTQNWDFFQSDVFSLPPMPSDAEALWFLFDFSAGSGTAWWDDVSLVCVSCANVVPTYSLSVTSNGCCPITVELPEGNQTVDPGNTTPFYGLPENTQVTLTAQAGVSCQFGNWTVDDQQPDTNQTIVVTMDSDHIATATCTPLYTLTVTSNGCCDVLVELPDGNQTVPAGNTTPFYSIPENTEIRLSAQTGEGCSFDYWLIDDVEADSGSAIVVTMDQNHTATVVCTETPIEQTYTAVNDFSTENGNPNGVWSYGWMPTDFSSFNLYTNYNSFQWYGWGSDNSPCIWINTGGLSYGVPTGWLSLHPGNGNQPSVLRWTAPVAGNVTVTGEFLAGDGGTMQVAVRLDNQPWWQATDSGSFDLITNVASGTTIDFAVYGGYGFGNTPISATISLQE